MSIRGMIIITINNKDSVTAVVCTWKYTRPYLTLYDDLGSNHFPRNYVGTTAILEEMIIW